MKGSKMSKDTRIPMDADEYKKRIGGLAWDMKVSYESTGKQSTPQLEKKWYETAKAEQEKTHRIKRQSSQNIIYCEDENLIKRYYELKDWSDSEGHFKGSNGDKFQVKIHVKNLSDERRKNAVKKESK